MSPWPSPPLGFLVKTIVPARDKPDDLGGPIPWLRIEDFTGKWIDGSASGQGVSEDTIRRMNLRVFPAGTVVCTCSCSMGTTAIVGRPLVTNQTFIGLLPRNGRINSDFLYYSLQAYKPQLDAQATGAIQSYLSRDDFRALRLPLPPFDIQVDIANFLDRETARIDAIIAAKRRTMALLEDRKSAVLDAWVCSLSGRFGSVPLRRLVRRVEQGWSPECDVIAAEIEDWGVLKTSAVTSGVFRAEENKRLPAGVEPNSRWVIRDGDLLVIRGSGSRNLVGQAAVADTQGRQLLLSDLIYRLIVREADPRFLAAVLKSPRVRGVLESLVRTDAGQTLKVRGDDLKVLPVPAAPYALQYDLWADLQGNMQGTDRAIRILGRQMELANEHRKALIAAIVTGEKTVPLVAA